MDEMFHIQVNRGALSLFIKRLNVEEFRRPAVNLTEILHISIIYFILKGLYI